MQNQYIKNSPIGKIKASEGRNDNKSKLQKTLRLLVINQFYPPDYAATGQLLSELATQLRSLGIKVNIFTGQPGYAFDKDCAPRTENVDGVGIRRSRTSRIWPRRIRGRVLNSLIFCLRAGMHLLKKTNRGDLLLITTEPPYLPVLGYFAYLLLRIPYVCLLYDLYPDVAVELKVVERHHWLVRFWNWLNCQVWKHSQGVIVLSSTMKDHVVAKCPQVKDRITVIHSWSNPDWIKPIHKSDNWFAHKFDLVENFTVLYSGNMGRCHDIDTILAAAAELQNEPIQFVFIGSGAKHRESIAKVANLGLDNCKFLPYQDKSVLPYSLTACDLSLVSISAGMEGLIAPSKLYGILAAGRSVAVICEAHSYLRKLVKDAKCGKAFDNGDSAGLAQFILHLAGNSTLARAQGLAGRRYLKAKFTPEIIAQQYLKILYQAKFDEDVEHRFLS